MGVLIAPARILTHSLRTSVARLAIQARSNAVHAPGVI
jgi:hypothetical protein